MGKRKRYIEGEDMISPNSIVGLLQSDEERIFALLVANGVPAAISYYTAFNTKASLATCSAYASRKLREPHIQCYLRLLYSYWVDGRLEFNESAIKG